MVLQKYHYKDSGSLTIPLKDRSTGRGFSADRLGLGRRMPRGEGLANKMREVAKSGSDTENESKKRVSSKTILFDSFSVGFQRNSVAYSVASVFLVPPG